MEFQHLVLIAGADEPRRLLHIHLLLEVTIQESGIDIHVVDFPTFMSRKLDEKMHRIHAHHRSENLVVVDPVVLHIPFMTSRTLCLAAAPRSSLLTLNTHLRPIARRPCGRSVSVQVQFSSIDSISSITAFRQLGCHSADANDVGSSVLTVYSSPDSSSRDT